MSTALDSRTAKIADQVMDEFIRLGVDAYEVAYSGLMTEVPNVVTDKCLIKVYDDYTSGFYDGEKLLSALKGIDPKDVSLESEASNNIWQILEGYEIEGAE